MSKQKYFGTDGIRGRVGVSPITPDFMLKLGWAVGKVFSQEGQSRVLIGKDTRISGYMFESALEAGLSAAGVDVRLLGPMPTPAIAYLTRTFNAQAGIVISASHNAFHDNGIKFFSGEGTKLPDDIELAIEAQLDQPMTTVDSEYLGKVARIEDARGRYIEFCKSTAPGLRLNGLRIVVDCANGATYDVAPHVFRELGATVLEVGVGPDGLNINQGCGSTAPETLRKIVLAENADLGIGFDGDGDRVVMVDHRGEVVDGDELIFIIARGQLEAKSFEGGVVGTLMSNMGMELALSELNIPFVRTNVGDRYVMEALYKNNWWLGGENSGHLICRNVTTTGDGIVAALQVLAGLAAREQTLNEYKKGMSKFPQVLVNVHAGNRQQLAENTAIKSAVKSVEEKLGGRGRVLLRPSGTEPVVRVMVEGEDKLVVTGLAAELAGVVESALA